MSKILPSVYGMQSAAASVFSNQEANFENTLIIYGKNRKPSAFLTHLYECTGRAVALHQVLVAVVAWTKC